MIGYNVTAERLRKHGVSIVHNIYNTRTQRLCKVFYPDHNWSHGDSIGHPKAYIEKVMADTNELERFWIG